MNQHVRDSLLKLTTDEPMCLDSEISEGIPCDQESIKYVVPSSGASADVNSSTHLLSRYCQVKYVNLLREIFTPVSNSHTMRSTTLNPSTGTTGTILSGFGAVFCYPARRRADCVAKSVHMRWGKG